MSLDDMPPARCSRLQYTISRWCTSSFQGAALLPPVICRNLEGVGTAGLPHSLFTLPFCFSLYAFCARRCLPKGARTNSATAGYLSFTGGSSGACSTQSAVLLAASQLVP